MKTDNRMKTYDDLLEHIQSLKIVDTHEHLPFESDRPVDSDVLSEWLIHYFSCDLVSAGLSDGDLAIARDSSKDLIERWRVVQPYWHAAQSTGYGRSLALAARDLYDINTIDEKTILELTR